MTYTYHIVYIYIYTYIYIYIHYIIHISLASRQGQDERLFATAPQNTLHVVTSFRERSITVSPNTTMSIDHWNALHVVTVLENEA